VNDTAQQPPWTAPVGSPAPAHETALRALQAGLWPVAIEPSGKSPVRIKGWGAVRPTPAGLAGIYHANPGAGVGLCLGPGRGPNGAWLIDVEGDGPLADESRERLFGNPLDSGNASKRSDTESETLGNPEEKRSESASECSDTVGWQSARGSHWLYTVDPDRFAAVLARLAGAERRDKPGVYHLAAYPDLELRCGGKKPSGHAKQLQSVIPPTPATDGQPRRWIGGPVIQSAPEGFYRALEAAAEQPQATSSKIKETQANARNAPDRDSLIRRAEAYVERMPPAISGQGGHDATFAAASALVNGFGLSIAEARPVLARYNLRCQPPWSDADLEHKLADAETNPRNQPRGYLATAGAGSNGNGHVLPRSATFCHDEGWRFALGLDPQAGRDGRGGTDLDAELANHHRTDMGNAERLVARHGHDLRYCHPWAKWLAWDGRRWKVDDTAEVYRRAKLTARYMLAEAGTVAEREDRDELVKWSFKSEGKGKLEAMAALASSEPGIPILPDLLDRDPWLLNCPNGVLDLRTGEIKPHRREDHITKLCPTPYDPDAECPLWEATLRLFLDDNERLIAYMQRLAGYCLTGVVREHALNVAYGTGANGKSTILGTLLDVIGTDYAIKAPPDLLMARTHEAHPTDRADLFGRRLVVVIETAEGRRLNESLVKELTGGDRIRARRMREDFWEFSPTHKLIMATNHKPVVRGTDHGIWRRMALIPFEVTVGPDKADPSMPDRLREEWPGILAWAVRGCAAWQAIGLQPPDEIKQATAAYRELEDVLGEFMEEHCVTGDSAFRVRSSDLYARYRIWTDRSGETPISQKRFSMTVLERGFHLVRNSGSWFVGIGLRPDSGEVAEAACAAGFQE